MSKTVLIAGKEFPFGGKLLNGLIFTNRNVCITVPPLEEDSVNKNNINNISNIGNIEENINGKAVEWNKASPVSCRNVILQSERYYEHINEAVLYFDEDFYASKAQRLDAEECTRVCDELILSYQYLALEVLSRFERKNNVQNPGKIVFVIKEGPCLADALLAPAVRNGINAIASPVIASAASAFCSFAQNFAVQYGDLPFVSIILVRGDNNIPDAASDELLGRWLGSYMDSVEKQKEKPGSKRAMQWIKPGTKGTGLSIIQRLLMFISNKS